MIAYSGSGVRVGDGVGVFVWVGVGVMVAVAVLVEVGVGVLVGVFVGVGVSVAKMLVTLVHDKEILACRAARSSRIGSALFMISLVSMQWFEGEPDQLLFRWEKHLEEGNWIEVRECAA